MCICICILCICICICMYFYYHTARKISVTKLTPSRLHHYPLRLRCLPRERHTWQECPRDNNVMSAMFQNNALSSSHLKAATKSEPEWKREAAVAATTWFAKRPTVSSDLRPILP